MATLTRTPSLPAPQAQYVDSSGRPTVEFYNFLSDLRRWLTSAAPAISLAVTASREVLSAGRTLYFRTDGSDSNDGLTDSPTGAFATVQKCFDTLATYDLNGQQCVVQHGVETGVKTFTASSTLNTMIGGGSVIIKGSPTVGNTVFDVTAADCFKVYDARCSVSFDQMTLKGGDLGQIHVLYNSIVSIGNAVYFDTAPIAHIWVHDRLAMLLCLGTAYKIIGGAGYHIFIQSGMCFHEACAITLTGTPAFSGAFATVMNGGVLQCVSFFAGGGATGPRYSAYANGVINVNGQGVNILPGNAAGSTATGGQYVP
jgi:hypothetical protein